MKAYYQRKIENIIKMTQHQNQVPSEVWMKVVTDEELMKHLDDQQRYQDLKLYQPTITDPVELKQNQEEISKLVKQQ